MLALCQPHLSEREKRKVAKRQGRDRRRGRQLVCEREKRYERMKRSKVTLGKRRQTVNGGGGGGGGGHGRVKKYKEKCNSFYRTHT